MSACPDKALLLHGLLDGELDAANAVALEEHVKTCRGCAEELRRQQGLRELLAQPGLRHAAPPYLRERVEAALDAEARPQRASGPRTARPWAPRPWLAGVRPQGGVAGGGIGTVLARPWIMAAGTALAAGLAVAVIIPQVTQPSLQSELVSDHIRSLQVGHLIDVVTSDRHTVKPWFNGKTDVAPPVVDLADQGFPLAGGRLDYVAGRVTPAIVYRRRAHVINLFVRTASGPALDLAERRGGYSLVRWRKGGQEFWAVSDVDLAELKTFHQLFAARAAP